MKFISSLFDSFLSPVLGKDKTFWMPEQASTYAYEIDYMFSAILWISTLFFVLIVLFMCYIAWKYRRREEGELSQPSPSHNTTLEIIAATQHHADIYTHAYLTQMNAHSILPHLTTAAQHRRQMYAHTHRTWMNPTSESFRCASSGFDFYCIWHPH